MSEKLDAYLEEISHFLAGRQEREEILAEIRSHILEKAEREFGEVSAETLEKVIAAYGPARRVAEQYLGDRPIIAPAFRRFLFRYTGLLFSIHFLFIVAAVIFKESFVVFPFLYMPRLGLAEAILYLPTAFLTELGIVALVLYLITQRAVRTSNFPGPGLRLTLRK
ncbi:MAG: HAAS signaling domain-containing protein [Candidatus Saccharicenans sp.]|uniref:HAAS signaling domain-containing protein n=1 Tax=Candidatus Saccharicenans sp. TaxID=2819258 RepID=UPI00404946B3